MKNLALLLILSLFISTNSVMAQCHLRKQRQIPPHEKSSVSVPEGFKKVKSLAKVSKREAKKTATKTYEGKVKEIELTTISNKLVWKVEVKGELGQKEMFIDPGNGEFLGYGLTK